MLFNFRIPTNPFCCLIKTYLLRARLADECPQVATFHQLKQKIHGLIYIVCRYPEKSNNVWMAKLAKNRQLQNDKGVIWNILTVFILAYWKPYACCKLSLNRKHVNQIYTANLKTEVCQKKYWLFISLRKMISKGRNDNSM